MEKEMRWTLEELVDRNCLGEIFEDYKWQMAELRKECEVGPHPAGTYEDLAKICRESYSMLFGEGEDEADLLRRLSEREERFEKRGVELARRLGEAG